VTPDQYCQQRAAQSGSSFYYSFLFLPPPRRRAITALYAFCREVDDAVDETADVGLARTKIAWWRREVDAMYAGNPQHPVTRALQPFLDECAIPAPRLHEVIDGMEMDLEKTRYVDFGELGRYCHLVAGVVGGLAAGIFGYRNPGTLAYAETLGTAFQLTNIIRDVGEDARRGRIYLPQEDLDRHCVRAGDILRGEASPAFVELMRFETRRARDHYDRALEQLPDVDRRAQRPGLVMAAIYRTLLREIEDDGFRVLGHRIALTPARKLWIAWRTWVFA
jgi:phytoene synthase